MGQLLTTIGLQVKQCLNIMTAIHSPACHRMTKKPRYNRFQPW
ncbi:MAG: hypothetical protein KZQ87_12410 [Candidatus Thiodiazotropha sp. (ex Cardiolucina cf. quadrata)]|nr:hypothetical protein [Candidatus Thiodiazotropha sp. (ex Cardiolucina cf. quadrata)]